MLYIRNVPFFRINRYNAGNGFILYSFYSEPDWGSKVTGKEAFCSIVASVDSELDKELNALQQKNRDDRMEYASIVNDEHGILGISTEWEHAVFLRPMAFAESVTDGEFYKFIYESLYSGGAEDPESYFGAVTYVEGTEHNCPPVIAIAAFQVFGTLAPIRRSPKYRLDNGKFFIVQPKDDKSEPTKFTYITACIVDELVVSEFRKVRNDDEDYIYCINYKFDQMRNGTASGYNMKNIDIHNPWYERLLRIDKGDNLFQIGDNQKGVSHKNGKLVTGLNQN